MPTWWWPMVFLCTCLAVITPSRGTIQMIAASEFAGATIQGEAGIRVASKLEQALDRLLEGGSK